MAYQLLQTNIALTGNIKTCCYIDGGEISDRVTLNPISTTAPIIPHNVNLSNSTYPRDLVDFYSTYKNIFYRPQVPFRYLTDSPYKKYVDEDKFVTGIVDDCMMGAKRVSLQKNGKQFSFFAPIYITSEDDIPSYVKFDFNIKDSEGKFRGLICTRTIKIEGTKLYNYLHRSFTNVNEGSNDPKIINLTLQNEANGVNVGTIRGFSVESEGLINLKTNLLTKLLSHDMTLIEFNNIICKEFENKNIVIPYIHNLCWYFDLEDFMPIGNFFEMENGKEINVVATYLDKDENVIKACNLDFNHEDIPVYGGKNKGANILTMKEGGLHDNELSDLAHNYVSKLNPTISKWALAGSDNKYIFNAYIGLSANSNNSTLYSFDPYVIDPDEKSRNLNWMTYLYKDMDVRTNITNKTDRDTLVKDISGDNGLLNLEYSLRTIYKLYSNQFVRAEMHDGYIVCNGIRYKVDSGAISAILGLDENTSVSKNMKVSFSYVDNSTILNADTMKTMLFILPTISKGVVTCCDFVFWIPRPISQANPYENIYEDISNTTEENLPSEDMVVKKVDENLRAVTFASAFDTWDSKYGTLDYAVIDTETWTERAKDTELHKQEPLRLIFEPLDRSSYLVNRRLSFDEGNNSLFINPDISDFYMDRYYGWIHPLLVDVVKVADNIHTADNAFIYYKGISDEDNINKINIGKNARIYPRLNNEVTIPEYKWFYDSCIRYAPQYIRKRILISSIDGSKNTMEDIYDRILEKVFDDQDIRSYAKSIYNITLDTDIEYSQYIITFELK